MQNTLPKVSEHQFFEVPLDKRDTGETWSENRVTRLTSLAGIAAQIEKWQASMKLEAIHSGQL